MRVPKRAAPLVGLNGEPLTPDESKTMRAFFADGRLVSIPANRRKRALILQWLRDAVFTEDREYPEAEVNQRLALFHPDVAALRRYMVDGGLVTRDHGRYRRAGLPFSLPPSPPGV